MKYKGNVTKRDMHEKQISLSVLIFLFWQYHKRSDFHVAAHTQLSLYMKLQSTCWRYSTIFYFYFLSWFIFPYTANFNFKGPVGNASGTNTGCPVCHSFVNVWHMSAGKKTKTLLSSGKTPLLLLKNYNYLFFHSILSSHPLIFEERVPNNKFVWIS